MNKKLEFERLQPNFIDYHNKKALFRTKFVSDMKHNGEIVNVFGLLKGKDIYNDRYIVIFNDGTINNNILGTELDFDNIKEKSKNKKVKEER